MTSTMRPPKLLEARHAGDETGPAGPEPAPRARRGYLMLNGAALVAITAMALGAIGILYLIQTSQVAQLGYQLSHLQQQYDDLTNANEKLQYQVDHDHSLPVVQQVALTQLGMVPMHDFKFIQVDRPSQDQLPPQAPEPRPHHSLWQRVRDALTGTSSADHVDPTTTAPPSRGNGATP